MNVGGRTKNMSDGSTAYSQPPQNVRPRIQSPSSNTHEVRNNHIYERDSDDMEYEPTTDSGTKHKIVHGYGGPISIIECAWGREGGRG